MEFSKKRQPANMEVYMGIIVFLPEFCALDYLLCLVCLQVMHSATILYLWQFVLYPIHSL
jgi:hypothetical protein